MKLRYWLILALHILLLLLLPQLIESQEQVPHQPQMCTEKTEQDWDVTHMLDRSVVKFGRAHARRACLKINLAPLNPFPTSP